MGEWIIIVFDYFGLFTKHADPMHNNRCLARTMLWKDSSKSRGVERMRGLLTGRKRIEMRKIIIIRCFSSSGEGQRPVKASLIFLCDYVTSRLIYLSKATIYVPPSTYRRVS